MIDLSTPATEAFQILRSFNYEVMLFDDSGKRVYEPEEARRMFCKPANMLISLVDDGDNSSIRLYLGKTIDIDQLHGLINTLRSMAYKYNMLFNVRRYNRELTVQDFSTTHSVREAHAREKVMKVFEGMYGTTRSSYLKLENARMIVRHGARVNENIIGARGRNIQSIFVENAQGERFLFPVHNLSAARAMTQHVNHGGTFADTIGEHIIEAAKHYSNLATASRHIHAHGRALDESAHEVRVGVREAMKENRRMFERMFRSGGYVNECRRITEQSETLTEDGKAEKISEQVSALRGMLTVEGVELSEAVLESVARTMHDRPIEEKKEGPKVEIKLGGGIVKAVDKTAWDEFKHGRLDVKAKPDMSEMPSFPTRTAELLVKLERLAAVVRDDSMANLLSFVSDRLPEEHDPMARENMRRIAVKALRSVDAVHEQARLGSPVIQEYNDWINEHAPETIFAEDDDMQLGSTDTFTFTAQVDGQDATVTATNHPATVGDDDSTAAHITIDKIEAPDGATIDTDSLDEDVLDDLRQQAVSEYADRVDDDDFAESVDYGDDEDDDLEEALMSVPGDEFGVGATQDQPDAEPPSVDSDLASCDDELTADDIVLPTNQGHDLEREVRVNTARDDAGNPVKVDPAYIARLQALAGMRRF